MRGVWGIDQLSSSRVCVVCTSMLTAFNGGQSSNVTTGMCVRVGVCCVVLCCCCLSLRNDGRGRHVCEQCRRRQGTIKRTIHRDQRRVLMFHAFTGHMTEKASLLRVEHCMITPGSYSRPTSVLLLLFLRVTSRHEPCGIIPYEMLRESLRAGRCGGPRRAA